VIAPSGLSLAMMLDLHTIAQTSALRIVDCLVEGTLITIFAGLLLGVARRQSSATRFATWFAVLVAIAVLPLLGGLASSQGTGIPAATLNKSIITVPVSWTLYLFSAWAAIAVWGLLGVGRGLWHLHVLRKTCVPVDSTLLDARLQETLARNQSPRAVALCVSDQVHVPTAIGVLRPAVVLPRWVMQELPPDELNQILLHELAHLRRWDDWTNLIQKVVKALFFFHPAVWWIEKRVSLEREMACDDAVLAETASPRAYAECLAHLAERTLIQRSMALAQAALGKIHQTSLRVALILDRNRPRSARSWKPAVSVVAAFAVASVLGISRAPRLIAFSDTASTQTAARAIVDSSVDGGSGSFSTSMPIVNVSAKQASRGSRQASGAPFLVRSVRAKWGVAPTKLTALKTQRKPEALGDNASLRSVPAEEGAAGLFHLAKANASPLVFTETLFVVIEHSEPGSADQPVLQVQLWGVMVLHPVANVNSNRTPAKQT
jgi:beta-lactamase regulating signal transducer with metallopeptidase domain